MLQRLLQWRRRRQAQQAARKRERAADERERARRAYLALLLDRRNDADTRYEAASELYSYGYDDAEVEQAYLAVALDHTADPELAEECGSNLGLLWSGNESLDAALLKQFHPVAFDACTQNLFDISRGREWMLLVSDTRWEYNKERRGEQHS